MKKRSIIQAVHVQFDDLTSFRKTEENSDDFEYVTLDFFRFNKKEKISSISIQIILFYENNGSENEIKNDNDETIEIDKNDKKLKNFQSRDQDPKPTKISKI